MDNINFAYKELMRILHNSYIQQHSLDEFAQIKLVEYQLSLIKKNPINLGFQRYLYANVNWMDLLIYIIIALYLHEYSQVCTNIEHFQCLPSSDIIPTI